MKAFIPAIAGALLFMGATSCNGGSSAPTTFDDSLSVAMGEMQGSQLNTQFASIPEADRAKFNKEEILKGIEQIIMTDTTKQSYMSGLQIGMQMWGQLFQMEASGIKVDRKALMAAYKKAFLADSVTNMAELQGNFQKFMGRAQEIMTVKAQEKAEAERQARLNEPDVKANIEAGKKYVEEQKAKDADIKTTASGLSYKVINEGAGDAITPTSTVKVNYVGRHIDGSEFDKGEGVSFPVARVVPGFAEGLQLMKKGAKYTLYIPGDLAYGIDGTGDGSIKPMETLVFDLEVVEIEK
ncbi:MAG: FKBP-type peptidyl-prolyl cis-trans isomerase [Muribaculaceae bacterium]|nr:FKBP-type peptidyl-prolyl cis-trans isomerase [Muribaculaceae bacterium]